MSPSTANVPRLRGLSWCLGLLFLAAVVTQAKVQLFDRGSIIERAKATKRFVITRVEYARRGRLSTRDGKPLAQDEDTYELNVEFAKTPKTAGFCMALSAASGIPASEFEQLALGGATSRVWRRPMAASEAAAVYLVKQQWRADGVSLARTGRRSYSLGEAASGFVGSFREGVATSGLELSQNAVLQGKNGQTIGLVDRSGAFLPMRQSSDSYGAKDGESVVLTIDSELQMAAAAAIKAAVEANKADDGTAIVMDPHSGDILAMANWPSYDPNRETPGKSGKYSSDLNPAYQVQLEPGSTFKILTLAKALDMGVVKPTDKVNCRGSLAIGDYGTVHCDSHHGSRAHGVLDPKMAIARSCNVSAATWAMKVGYDQMVGYVQSLGLLHKTGIGVPGEVAGRFNFEEYAKRLQIATLGFGQSITATPVGLADAFAILGNGGRRPSPRLIAKVGGMTVKKPEAQRVISASAARTVLDFMEAVIATKEGTGAKLRIPGYRLAGKTGTAQKVNRIAGGKGYVANFVGFVPMPEPRAMILVMVDNPKGDRYYGATVAGPAFVDLAKAVIRRYGITPSTPLPAAVAAAPPTSRRKK